MIKSYLENRLVYDTEEGSKDYQITGGVPQGSVLQYTITSQPSIRFLGVMLDATLSFKPHVDHYQLWVLTSVP